MMVMKPPVFVRALTDMERERLQTGLRSSKVFVLKRSQILLASAQSKTVPQIQAAFGYAPQTIRQVLHAFNREGMAALSKRSNRPHSGPAAAPVLDEDKRQRLHELLEQSPRTFGKDTSVWTLAVVAQVAHEQGLTSTRLNIETIRIALKRLGLNWRRAKAWIASPDPAYARKKSGATG
jgi:transposase